MSNTVTVRFAPYAWSAVLWSKVSDAEFAPLTGWAQLKTLIEGKGKHNTEKVDYAPRFARAIEHCAKAYPDTVVSGSNTIQAFFDALKTYCPQLDKNQNVTDLYWD